MVKFLTFFGIFLVVGGLLSAFFILLSPFLGAAIMGLGLVILALFFFVEFLALLRYGPTKTKWFHFTLGLLAVAVLLLVGSFYFQYPVFDLTTDTQNPPKFLYPAYPFAIGKGREFLDSSLQLNREYDPEFAGEQATRHPELEGVTIKLPPKDLYPQLFNFIKNQWEAGNIVMDDSQTFHTEMELEDPIFHFIDDMALEIRTDSSKPHQSRVEYRGRSRMGWLNFGANANRMQALREHLASLEQKYAAKTAVPQATSPAPAPPAPAVKPEKKK